MSETSTGKEILEKVQKSCFKKFSDNKGDQNDRLLYDYKQESLKVLKNTAFLAEKIMKGIRGGKKKLSRRCFSNVLILILIIKVLFCVFEYN